MRTSPSMVSFGGFARGRGAMFGPRITWTDDRSFGGHSNPDVSTGYFVGSFSVGSVPRSRGSVISPSRARSRTRGRSEEHTSELQSRLHLVCRLLLEKKKKKKIHHLQHKCKSIY